MEAESRHSPESFANSRFHNSIITLASLFKLKNSQDNTKENNMIYLVSGSGAPNYGDELILSMWIRFIQNSRPTENLVVDTHIPANTHRCHELSGPLIVTDNVWQIAKNVGEKLDFWDAFEVGSNFFNQGHYKNFSETNFVSVAENITIFHIHGGGFISTRQPKAGFLLGLAQSLSRTFATKIYGTGLGIEPFDLPPDKHKVIRQLLDTFSLFECRDTVSAKKLSQVFGSELHMPCGLDDNYLEKLKIHPSALCDREPAMHLSFSWPLPKACDEKIFDEINKMRDKYPHVLVWQSYPWKERETIIRLVRHLGHVQVFSTEELTKNGAPVRPGDFMLTTKFHPHFVAARLGCTGNFISNSVYYDVKHESVSSLGSPFSRFEDKIISPGNVLRSSKIVEDEQLQINRKQETARSIYG